MAALTGFDLAGRLVASGLWLKETYRLVIDIQAGRPVQLYYDAFADKTMVERHLLPALPAVAALAEVHAANTPPPVDPQEHNVIERAALVDDQLAIAADWMEEHGWEQRAAQLRKWAASVAWSNAFLERLADAGMIPPNTRQLTIYVEQDSIVTMDCYCYADHTLPNAELPKLLEGAKVTIHNYSNQIKLSFPPPPREDS